MTDGVCGIHHITAIASDPQKCITFYTDTLGLRLLKLTVNYDDPETYHLYFGDSTGSPGSILTFFPWPLMPRGRQGTGQAISVAYSVPLGSFEFWRKRLASVGVVSRHTENAFEEESLLVEDPDGLEIRLVEAADNRAPWGNGPVPSEYEIRGFHSTTISVEGYERTAGIMTAQLGFRKEAERGNRFRYLCGSGEPGTIVDVLCQPDMRSGTLGAGIVHHVAFRAHTEAHQLDLRMKLASAGLNVTPVIDRNYFKSLYFREPGRVLFEIATDGPGFAVDESPEQLGSGLQLPPFLVEGRSEIEKSLPRLRLPNGSIVGGRG